MSEWHRQYGRIFRSGNELSEAYTSYQYCRHRGIVHLSSRSDLANTTWRMSRLELEMLHIKALKGVSSIGPLVSVIASWVTAGFRLRGLNAYSRKAHIGANTLETSIVLHFQILVHPCRSREETS